LIAIESLMVYWASTGNLDMLLMKDASKQMLIVAGGGLVQESRILPTGKSRGLCSSRVTGQSTYVDINVN
jgi:hypothetical protein